MNREQAMQILHEFAWPEKLVNPLAVFEIQFRKQYQKPLFFETASKEELQEAIDELIESCKNYLEEFETNKYKSNKVISNQTADDIRYAFRYWCIIKNISEIRFEHFEEFAKQYSIDNNTPIEFYLEPEELEGCEDDYLNDYKENDPEKLNHTLYEFICDLETDMAGDQMPRQWDNYIKYFNINGVQIISGNRQYPNYYEKDIIKFLK